MFNKSLSLLLKALVPLLCLIPLTISAGVFSGADVSKNGERNWYLGIQSEEALYYGLFVGQNQYEIDNTAYSHRYMAGGIGYRWYGSWTTNVLLGFENSRLNEAGQRGAQGKPFSGLYTQLGLMKFFGDKNVEYLLSYSEDSEQIWSRFRLKFYTPVHLLLGPEVVVSRFLDSDYQDLGLVLEKNISRYTITGRFGVRNQTNFTTAYGGIEFYMPF